MRLPTPGPAGSYLKQALSRAQRVSGRCARTEGDLGATGVDVREVIRVGGQLEVVTTHRTTGGGHVHALSQRALQHTAAAAAPLSTPVVEAPSLPAAPWRTSSHSPGHTASSSSVALPSAAPVVAPMSEEQLQQLVDLLQSSNNVVAITGAGCSTESGVPDYRGPSGAYTRHGFKPMTHQQFMAGAAQRARYFARSFYGWHEFSRSQPSGAHVGLARLVQNGWVSHIITQNVDRLHHKAGTPPNKVLELHGTTHEVRCLQCGHVGSRADLQAKLAQLNPAAAEAAAKLAATSLQQAAQQQLRQRSHPGPHIARSSQVPTPQQHTAAAPSQQHASSTLSAAASEEGRDRADEGSGHYRLAAMSEGHDHTARHVAGSRALATPGVQPAEPSSGQPVTPAPHLVPVRRPDGDVELQDAGQGFVVPACERCGGILKPEVVFFGDNIPKPRALRSTEIASQADLLLVVGSSLMVYSAFRLVEACKRGGGKVVVVNVGPTRADPVHDLKLEVLAGEAMMRAAAHPQLLLPKV